jgi:hypothetical protein
VTPSALAQRLAEHIAAAPTQRVEFAALYEAAVAFDRSLATAPSARGEIRAALDELVAAGLVTLPRALRHFDGRDEPPLPLWVRRPSREPAVRVTRNARVWPAALEAAGRIATRDDEIGLLKAIAGFLRDGGESRPTVAPLYVKKAVLRGVESLVRVRAVTGPKCRSQGLDRPR